MISNLLSLSSFFALLLFVNFEADAANPKLRVGDKFPDIKLQYLFEKKAFNQKIIAGKVVLIDFWGSDCAPCRESIPELNALHRELKSEKFIMIGINVDEDDRDTKNFLETFKPTYILLDDKKHSLIKTLGVEEMPTTYILNRDREIRFINKGFRSGDKKVLKDQINKLQRR